MNNLLFTFLKWRPWMLFCIYVAVSCALLFGNNPYQQSVFLTSANSVTSGVYEATNNVTSYFNLHDINEDLHRRNASLELQVLQLQQRLQSYEEAGIAVSLPKDSIFQRYDFIIAHVINNSVHRPRNYITINKGSEDGILPDMGVVDQNGVVGKVNVVGPHSSRVISVLNDLFRFSCKVKGSDHVGSMVWNGEDSRFALLEELPRHSEFNVGDTIVTSGYSTTFPGGIPVGVVENELKDYDENFYTLKVRLFTDFSKLSTVRIVIDRMAEEIKMVETKSEEKDNKSASKSNG